MDLRSRLARWALARPHVLLLDAPPARDLRWQAEAEIDARGWRHATSPADTDVLLVTGRPGPELGAAADLLWSQVPAPRLRLDVPDGEGLGSALDAAVGRLAVTGADPAPADPWAAVPQPGGDDAGTDHGGTDHGGTDHGGGHEHMHHGGDVAGLAMADTAPDRDGLQLDALAVSLGPWLPGWPTGLVVSGRLQGDVLTAPQARWLDGASQPPPEPARPDLLALDVLARLLVVAGWPTAARQARAARTALLSRDPNGRAAAARVGSTVARSRILAWSLRGLGPRPAGDDVLDRVRAWCAVAADPAQAPPRGVDPDELATLLDGAELAAARLTVASLDVQLTRAFAPVAGGHHHG